jgi:hypothetical protein
MKLGYARVSTEEQSLDVQLLRSAEFSDDRKRRFILLRSWRGCNGPRFANFIMLNPSDADEEKDDMTAAKGIGFGRRWGFNGVLFTNLSAFVSTSPLGIPSWAGLDPQNTAALLECMAASELLVAAWGQQPVKLMRRIGMNQLIDHVRMLAKRDLYCIGKTRYGFPLHPSRAGYTDQPQLWRRW